MPATPRFVFASDSLKGTLSSLDAARLLGEAAERHFPGCSLTSVPVADGGEGTLDVLLATGIRIGAILAICARSDAFLAASDGTDLFLAYCLRVDAHAAGEILV